VRGIYQHCAEKHLHHYLAEYDFRCDNRIALGVNDGERAARAIASASGKRQISSAMKPDYSAAAKRFVRPAEEESEDRTEKTYSRALLAVTQAPLNACQKGPNRSSLNFGIEKPPVNQTDGLFRFQNCNRNP
jgi:hypothetical protein